MTVEARSGTGKVGSLRPGMQRKRGRGVNTYMHPIDGILEVIVQAS